MSCNDAIIGFVVSLDGGVPSANDKLFHFATQPHHITKKLQGMMDSLLHANDQHSGWVGKATSQQVNFFHQNASHVCLCGKVTKTLINEAF